MLVRDYDGVEIFRFFADLGQPPRQFADAQTGVYKDAGFRSGEERRVTGTAAREYAKPDHVAKDETILLRSVLTQRCVARTLVSAAPTLVSALDFSYEYPRRVFLRRHLRFNDVHQFLHRARALMERGCLFIR